MHAIEFTTKLSGESVLHLPSEVADQLPKHGNARVIVLTEDDPEDAQWRQASYEHFFRDESSDDDVYDSVK